MRPKFYLDIIICPGDAGANFVRNRIMQKLHGFFGHNKENGQCLYAIAFPSEEIQENRNTVLRIFSSTENELRRLKDEMRQIAICRDYAFFCEPAKVPDVFEGTWTRYMRYRIPTTGSDRHACGGRSELRDRRIQKAMSFRTAYFILHSSSSGSTFTLRVKAEHAAEENEDCMPDCYGLSVSSRPFALPDIEWTH